MQTAYQLELVPAGEPALARLTWPNGGREQIPLVRLPAAFTEWQLRNRIANLKFFLTGQGEREFAVHTGYMVTRRPAGFPLNAAAKGIGLLPKGDLEELTQTIDPTLKPPL